MGLQIASVALGRNWLRSALAMLGLVIGVARKGNQRALAEAGAHLVVTDLAELVRG